LKMTSETHRSRNAAIIGSIVLGFILIVAGVTYWMIGPAPRCELPADGSAEPGWSARVVNSNGTERCYFLYVPDDYDPNQPMPLVFSFHGFSSNPNSQSLISGWHKLADKEGFLVVYPQGTDFPQRWDSGTTWNVTEVDDVQYFLDMLEDVSTVAAVDTTRVYVNGFSNGGGMTLLLGCEVADKIAAIGIVSGAVVGIEGCNPSRPLPVMAFHGTSDPVVPYEGGDMHYRLLQWGAVETHAPSYFIGANDWVRIWAEGNDCDPNPESIPAQGDVSGIRYVGCSDHAAVILYTIDGGGHTWPGGMPLVITGKTSSDINATDMLWQFFQRYQLENQP
jgi:polyhydroxybutyrate depolymerase